MSWRDTIETGGQLRPALSEAILKSTFKVKQSGTQIPALKLDDLRIVKYFAPDADRPGSRHVLSCVSESHDGFAKIKLELEPEWTPAVVAVAFGKKDEAVAAKAFSSKEIALAEAYFQNVATEKIIAANTPDDQVGEAHEAAQKSLMTKIQINIGTIYRLQDWAKQPRDESMPLEQLVGTHFSGVAVDQGQYGVEIRTVYSVPKAAKKAVDTAIPKTATA